MADPVAECIKSPHIDSSGLRRRCVRPGGHDSWCLTVDGVTFNNTCPSVSCSCDGAAYFTPEQNQARRPFIINDDCPVHHPQAAPNHHARYGNCAPCSVAANRVRLCGHEHKWSEWVNGSGGARYRFCLDSYCSDGEIR